MTSRSVINYCESMIIAEEGFLKKYFKKRTDDKIIVEQRKNEYKQTEIERLNNGCATRQKIAKFISSNYNKKDSSVKTMVSEDISESKGTLNQYNYTTIRSDGKEFDREIYVSIIEDAIDTFGKMMDKYHIYIYARDDEIVIGSEILPMGVKWTEHNRLL